MTAAISAEDATRCRWASAGAHLSCWFRFNRPRCCVARGPSAKALVSMRSAISLWTRSAALHGGARHRPGYWVVRPVNTEPSPPTSIRSACNCETDRLREIHRRASYIWPEDRPNLDANPDIFGVDHTAITAGRVRVTTDRTGELLGFATWRPTGSDARLDDLFVEPHAMRRGIGSALVDDAAHRAGQAGLGRLLVVAHPRTLTFYKRAGFVEEGPATTRFGPALQLARDLRQPSS